MLARGCRLGGERCFALSQERILKNLRIPGDKRPEGTRPWMKGDIAPNPNPPPKMKAAVKKAVSVDQTTSALLGRPSGASSSTDMLASGTAFTVHSEASSSKDAGPILTGTSSSSIVTCGISNDRPERRNTVTIVHPEGPAVGSLPALSNPKMVKRSDSTTSSGFPSVMPGGPDLGSVLRVVDRHERQEAMSIPGLAPCTPVATPHATPQVPRQDPAPSAFSPQGPLKSLSSTTTNRLPPTSCLPQDHPAGDLALNILPLPADID